MEHLKQVLAQEDTILFIGSGISVWSGLPTWSGMIEELAQFVDQGGSNADLIRTEASRGELLQAASYGFDKLTKQQIGEFIRSASRYGIAKPHEIHHKIVSLGPRCFITTNYDDLVEQSLRKWQPDRFYPTPVTNRQLTELAGIVHARAIDFIFKPHGDAADSESIILTREQYRQLLPQGERQAALESLKMLLASRPVIYLGFGLRDPDFIYLRDLLANTYKGATRDHYAIMPDVSEPEVDYWRRNYGILLLNYTTTQRPADKSRDHSALLTLLDSLLESAPAATALTGFDPKSPDVLLALARHAAALGRAQKLSREFSIRVHSQHRSGSGIWDRFDHCPVEDFLDTGPERAILVGLPGAGKTYSLRRSAARLADRLHDMCLAETCDQNDIIIPIIADLKLYSGDLNQLVNQNLPRSLPLCELIRCFKVKVFLDSFNEMPREFWESGSYEVDFQQFSKELGAANLIISSRTADGLAKLELPTYYLDHIDDVAMEEELSRLGINFAGRFRRDVLRLLQRPFYFQHIISGAVTLPAEPHPLDFYKSFFAILSNAFAARFGKQLNLEKLFSSIAFEALNWGQEAFPLSKMLRSLKTSFDKTSSSGLNPQDVANWLVSYSFLIPHSGGRIAFVHQSITEYLAATELAKRYLVDPGVLSEKLTLTRWDQALFLALSLLPPTQGESFLKHIIQADFCLALNAVKFLEIGRDEVVSRLLSEVPERSRNAAPSNFGIQSALEYSLPLNEMHEPDLWKIVECGGSIGASAVSRLVEMKGAAVKNELLQFLLSRRGDFNFCNNGIGRALSPFATVEDVRQISIWANAIQAQLTEESDENDFNGFICGAATLLKHVDLSVIRREFLPTDVGSTVQRVRSLILCDLLHGHHSTEALDLAAELLLGGINEAATAMYFIAEFAGDNVELSWATFTTAHVDRLIEIIDDADESWVIDALRCLCEARPDLAESVKQKAHRTSGIEKAALLYCVSPSDLTPVFQAMGELLHISETERSKAPVSILERIEFDWGGRERLFVKLLRLRDVSLAAALFGGSSPPDVPNLGVLDIGPLDWWLDWVLEVEGGGESQWFVDQMGGLLAGHLNQDTLDQILIEFNKPDSRFRSLLLCFVIPHIKEITTDAFTEDTTSFLLADLNREGSAMSFRGHLLGTTATERFVIERLLPLPAEARPPFALNLRAVLTQAGSRHGRRYVLD